MAKKTLRIASVDEKVTSLIDRGREVDEQIKNLTVEDKGIKVIVGKAGMESLQLGETSVKLAGFRALATVSAIEKYELDPSKDDFHVADLAIRSGAFGDAVKAVKVLNVPPDQIDKAAEVLKAAGINCMVTVGYNIDADEYKALAGSTPSTDEMRAAIVALGKCITSKTSTRISYEMKK